MESIQDNICVEIQRMSLWRDAVTRRLLAKLMGFVVLLSVGVYVFAVETTSVAAESTETQSTTTAETTGSAVIAKSASNTKSTEGTNSKELTETASSDVLRHEVQRPQGGTIPPPPGNQGTASESTRWESGGSSAFNLPAVNGSDRATGSAGSAPNSLPGTPASGGTPTPPTGTGSTTGAGSSTGGNSIAGNGVNTGKGTNLGGGSGSGAFGGTWTAQNTATNPLGRGTSDRFTPRDEFTTDGSPNPIENNSLGKEPPQWSNGTLVLLLLISLGLNGYMVWLTLDTRNRYFRLMNEMNGDSQNDDEPNRRTSRSSERESRESRGTRDSRDSREDRETRGNSGTNRWRNRFDRVRNMSRDAVERLNRRRNRNSSSNIDDENEEQG